MSKIFIVDDVKVFSQPLAAVLQMAGYTTVTAENGQEALTLARNQRIDLVLLDMGMPVMDGMAFLRKLRADKDLQRLPVIALTAVPNRDYIINSAGLGVCEYLLNSAFSSADLLARVRKTIGLPKGSPMAPAQKSAARPAEPKTHTAGDTAGSSGNIRSPAA